MWLSILATICSILRSTMSLLSLTSEYLNIFPKEPDLPLLQGYVHKHQGLSEQARQDFTEALTRDPEVVTAYVNRGYMLNDLHQAQAAASDFEAALKQGA
jgi:tetratricopeptide (TPR) repeat protein